MAEIRAFLKSFDYPKQSVCNVRYGFPVEDVFAAAKCYMMNHAGHSSPITAFEAAQGAAKMWKEEDRGKCKDSAFAELVLQYLYIYEVGSQAAFIRYMNTMSVNDTVYYPHRCFLDLV